MDVQVPRLLIYTGDETAIREGLHARSVKGTQFATKYRIDEAPIGELVIPAPSKPEDRVVMLAALEALNLCQDNFLQQENWQRPISDAIADLQALLEIK